MNPNQFQPESEISKDFLENIGVPIPFDAVAFYTEKDVIVFCVHLFDELGTSIVFKEEFLEYDLSEQQVAELKAADCYGSKGWKLV